MANLPTISDFEIAKLLLDPKRNRILTITADEPMTVKQIAERMDELPSRLYYHVKKLEEVGFLELVDTKQQGNLIEKYYKSSPKVNNSYHLDDRMVFENSAYLLQRIYSLINSGMNLVQHDMESGSKESFASANISFKSFTHEEWEQSQLRISDALSVKSVETIQSDSQIEATGQPKQLVLDKDQKDEYVYVMLTYRLKDAERLANEKLKTDNKQ